MKFGTKVLVTRGSEKIEAGVKGCLRKIKATVIGACKQDLKCRLDESDGLSTFNDLSKPGDIGMWSVSCVERLP